MRVNIGLENGFENRSIAWALDYPGCFAYGTEGSEAILRIPERLLRYKEWVDSHLEDSWMKDLVDFDIHLTETIGKFNTDEILQPSSESKKFDPWFQDDAALMSADDIHRGLDVLHWSREDLLELVTSLTPEQLTREISGERWNILGVLKHVAVAEFWYLDRLSLGHLTREQLPKDIFERLLIVRSNLYEALPTTTGVKDVRVVDGETWSPRKILRRAAWHEIDHIEHIFKLISLL